MRKIAIVSLALMLMLTSCGDQTVKDKRTINKNSEELSDNKEKSSEEDYSRAEYDRIVSTFEEIGFGELLEKIDNKETFLLYVGYKNCPDCRNFLPVFEKIRDKFDLEIFYSDGGQFSPELDEFMKRYDVEYVPILATITEGEFKNLDVGEGEFKEEDIEDKLSDFIRQIN